MGSDQFRIMVLIEMIARIVKNDLRKVLRKVSYQQKHVVDEPYRMCLLQHLNVVFSSNENSFEYWNNHIVKKLKDDFQISPKNYKHFPKNLKHALFVVHSLLTSDNKLVKFDARLFLFERIKQLAGIKFSNEINNLIKLHPNVFLSPLIFHEIDNAKLSVKIKHIVNSFFFGSKKN